MKLKATSNGFSIIELLVVIAIIALVSGGGLASYTTFSKQQKLTNESNKFRDVLELAKQKAVSNEKKDVEGVDICENTGIGYPFLRGFRVTVDATEITLQAACSDTETGAVDEYSSVLATYPIDPRVTVVSPPSTVEFATLTGAATVGGTSPISFQTSTTRKRCFTVNSFGVITEYQDGSCTVST